ncbi:MULTISPECIES: D-2-hydroxyacid dehydrogenase [unclassified Arcicella]|uniref:D-2-hydroxyacid dehydrogenase n=1 Tax=unclassified Arcicella TaxID=2644986 RepID=UPI0028586288|nr:MULTISPECIES: D-2-hydroxyacid dehydrogenase [unclassified Arcicella]MDR6561897.1 phosphoglycerate dehydrogenase-like enzyme [Arcicella sp. BE51]MDR6814043.1 phosphoglycerate dehydrogenase-like enzyme [Arcicella sp. BE140]MDR6825250.1 phosphoglycerate dehydrogenase-like enzyme [Arcicella sp. BE139]
MKIYIHTKFEENEALLIKEQLSEKYKIVIGEEIPAEKREEEFLSASICFGNVPLAWAQKTTQLKWLQLHSAGLDPYQQLTDHTFKITNLKGFFGQSVAETAVAGILAMYRGVNHLTQLQMQTKWIGTPLRSTLHLLNNAKVLVLGAGAIGLKVRDLLTGFNCKTTVLDSKTITQLEEHLPTTDIVVATLPETPETIGLFNKERLHLLKCTALFVNVGRGSAVDEQALIEMLLNNQLYGAVLDVTATEPLPDDHLLWQMHNVLLTQHTSGGWANENIDKIKFFLENLSRFECGEALVNIANLARGY